MTATLDTVPASDRYNTAEENAALIQLGGFINRSTLIQTETFSASDTPVGIGGGFMPPDFEALASLAQTTVDPAARQGVVDQISKQLYEEGPFVVWGYANNLDVALSGINGVATSQSLPLCGRASLG